MKRAVGLGLILLAGCKEAPVASTPRPAWKPVNHIRPGTRLVSDFAVPVLMYHRIANLTPKEERSPLMRDLTVSPKDFEEQVRYLKEEGFTFLFAREVEDALREGRPLPEKAICLTMDDGYRDNFEEAFPILQRHGACATVFVVTKSIGRSDRLHWNEMQQMKRGDTDFGSHSVSHPDLTTLNNETLDFELRESKSVLEKGLEMPISSVAYPSGAYDDRVVDRARLAGYLSGWKKGGGPVRPGDEPMLLPRVRVHGRTTPEKFRRSVWSGVYVRAEESSRGSGHFAALEPQSQRDRS